MRNQDIIRLRQEALRFSGEHAQRLSDKIFGFLLYQAITNPDRGLGIVIVSDDPGAYEPGKREHDRIYVVDRVSRMKTGTRQKRLKRDWALSAYMIGSVEQARQWHGAPPKRFEPSTDELRTLTSGAAAILGAASPEVFEPDPRHSGKRMPAHV